LKDHFSNIVARPNGVGEYFLGRRKNFLLKLYAKDEPLHPNLARMVINISILDAWLEKHQISIGL
jgi:hypothetical protein